jgi:hypothetical protein
LEPIPQTDGLTKNYYKSARRRRAAKPGKDATKIVLFLFLDSFDQENEEEDQDA